MFTPEDEVDVIHEELGRARRALWEKERAPFDRRVCDPERWSDSLGAARARVLKLERDLAEAQAAAVAEDEAYDRERRVTPLAAVLWSVAAWFAVVWALTLVLS